MARTAWKAVADHLAVRLANHAYCDVHPEDRYDPACPACRDRSAYLRYLAAGGRDHRERCESESISLTEFINQCEAGSR